MKRQLTLSEFRFLLGRIDPLFTVRFDFCGFVPTSFDSYRGYYDQLALGFEETGKMTVAQLVELCEKADGASFQGYKGGDYRMTPNTPLWVSNYGKCNSTSIIGVMDTGYDAVIETAFLT